MHIAFVKDIYSPLHDPRLRHHEVDLPLEKFVRLFESRLKWTGRKEDNHMFLMAHIKPFKDSTKRESKPGQKPDRWAGFPSRCNANIIAATALVYDIDNKDTMPVIDPAWFVQGFLKFKAVMHPARPASRAIRGEGSLSRLLME